MFSKLRWPTGVALDSSGNVYVADTSNYRIQKFSSGISNWIQTNINGFGNNDNAGITTLSPFSDMLYAGTWNWDVGGAEIWRSIDGQNWQSVMSGGFGNGTNYGIDHLLPFNGYLYAGAWSDDVNGGEVWRSNDGTTWNQVVNQGFGDTTNAEVFRLVEYSGNLYASTWSDPAVHGSEVWRSASGDSGSWSKVVSNGFGDSNNGGTVSFADYNGYLYAGTSNSVTGGEIWRSLTGNAGSWTQINISGFGTPDNDAITALTIFNGYLYAATYRTPDTGGTQIWRCQTCDGSDWSQVVNDGFGKSENRRNTALEVFHGRLYAVVGNDVTGLEVWRTSNGTSWQQVGFNGLGTSNNIITYWDNALTVFGDELFLGTLPFRTGGGQVWKMNIPDTNLPTPWVGGVTISADQNVAAIGRPHVGSQIMTYNGFSAGSLTAYVPMLFKDAFGGSYDSALYVQNVDSSNIANITIHFYDSSGVETYSMTDTISPLASKGYWLPSITSLGTSWVGGVKVESDQDIVAVGRPHIGNEVTTYNGFSIGSLSVSIPMLFKDAYGGSYDSALYVQNVDSSNIANITIHFYDSNGVETDSMTDTISPLASKGYWLPSITGLGTSWVGGVVVESDQNIVAVGRPHIGSQVMTYNGFTVGGFNAFIPMLFKDAFGGSYDSALYVQNVNSTNSANITINFYDANGNLTCVRVDSIQPLASLGYWLPNLTCEP